MVVFELTMPNFNTWNGRWSGENKRFIRVKPNRLVPKDIVGKGYFYDFGSYADGNFQRKNGDFS